MAQQFRNDEKKRTVIPENLRSRFIRDPENIFLDSGYCCAMAQQFRNDEKKRTVIPENLRSRFIRDPREYISGFRISLCNGRAIPE